MVATTVASKKTKERYALMSSCRYLEKKMEIIEKPGKKDSSTGRVDSGVGEDCAAVTFWDWRRDAMILICLLGLLWGVVGNNDGVVFARGR